MITAARRRLRTEESWVEISSRPSSSSSLAALADGPGRLPDERIPRPLVPRRSVTEPPRSASASAAGSSQDEYEDSSSESDRVLSSSNEELSRDAISDDEDDDNRTALGIPPTAVFTPQPNAFSHPPSSRPSQGSYFPRTTSAPNSHIRDRPLRSRPHLHRERERTGMASSYQPDHDAALRASLTTLLSCAAAVRPKPTSPDTDKEKLAERPIHSRPSAQPTMMRIIPESELDGNRPDPPKANKRRSRESSKERQAKKMRAQKMNAAAYSYDDYFISPTVASWVISAGMVLVFSAISFSAGYAWGREAGRIESEMRLTGGTCGKEVMKSSGSGLRHWGKASTVRT
ncbi:uncharacterized protein HMPREF1541_08434 [Cyphellophora europaea CBS 101466]|uniref:Uncharacterized protein n=1 Tax=Cyphellophora europaea (strain CBS 101466) TaxID=1220924 RepID=W2RP38_CYPE1|nr:uncharacterized protein HMPREF1541_08434 [Cyphellophora europaea CBS 101466]ETN37443.1 hypothetical protein HMPREF1541_08434 [Cyphellophora europaea CBS 101466]